MRILVVSLLLFCTLRARADMWLPPTTIVVHSNDANIVVRVDPIQPDPNKPFGIKRNNQHAIAIITKWDKTENGYRFVRRVILRNPISPVDVLITNDARFLITLDDWNNTSTTENAVVIYDLQTGTIHNHKLEDFLPASYVQKFQRMEFWRRDAFVDESSHTIDVYMPDTKPDSRGLEPYIAIDPAKNKIWLQKE